MRPGRSVELVDASLSDAEGEVIKARAWRLRIAPVDLPTGIGSTDGPGLIGSSPSTLRPGFAPDGPAVARAGGFPETGSDVGYHTAMEYRFLSGSFTEPGPAVVWMRMRQPLVEGEDPSPLQRVLVAADSGNGVSAALDWSRYLFINVELTVHLHRGLVGEWVCMDAITIAGGERSGRRRHCALRRGWSDRPRGAGLACRRARGTVSSASRPRVLVARVLLPAGLAMLEAGCEVVQGGLDVRRERLLELAAGVDGIVADPTVGVDDELLEAAGPQLRVRRQLRGRIRQRRSRSVPAPGRRRHQHAGRADQCDGRAGAGLDRRGGAADERRRGRACAAGPG